MRDRGQMRPVADRVVVCDVSGDVNCRHLHSSKSGIAIKFMLRGTEKTPALSLDAERGPRTPLAELDQVEQLALFRLGNVRGLVRILQRVRPDSSRTQRTRKVSKCGRHHCARQSPISQSSLLSVEPSGESSIVCRRLRRPCASSSPGLR